MGAKLIESHTIIAPCFDHCRIDAASRRDLDIGIEIFGLEGPGREGVFAWFAGLTPRSTGGAAASKSNRFGKAAPRSTQSLGREERFARNSITNSLRRKENILRDVKHCRGAWFRPILAVLAMIGRVVRTDLVRWLRVNRKFRQGRFSQAFVDVPGFGQ